MFVHHTFSKAWEIPDALYFSLSSIGNQLSNFQLLLSIGFAVATVLTLFSNF